MAYTIGPGVKQAMADAGDVPRSNEMYQPKAPGEHQISMTYGRDALYVWYEEDNRVNRLPFDS